MSITTHSLLINSLRNSSYQQLIVDKASLTNQLAGFWGSYWTSTGFPTAGAIPAAAVAVCNNSLTGGIRTVNPIGTDKMYIGSIDAMMINGLQSVEIHDRLVHMGGLSGIVSTPTAQNVLIDLANTTLLSASNLDARKGAADYSEVHWWVENYTDCGATTVTLTANAIFSDGTSGNLTGLSLQRFRTGQSYLLNSLIPAAQAGKYIRGINTITLSANTTGAGNFGVTCTIFKASVFLPIASMTEKRYWRCISMPEIKASSCLSLIAPASITGNPGALRAVIRTCNG
jgi:hypothetical protein